MIVDSWLPCYANLIISRRHRLIFCPVPKVACSNWKMTLRQASGFDDFTDDHLAHDRENNGLDYLGRHNRLVRLRYLNDPRYTKACFVRNPWTRALSGYRSKLEGALAKRAGDADDPRSSWIFRSVEAVKEFCRANGQIEDDGSPEVTFGEFLNYLEGTPPAALNEHWQPQSLITGFERIKYDFVGRLETLSEDAARLIERTGLPALYTGPVKTVPPTRSKDDDVLRRYFTPERIAQVGRIYAADIAFLGYQPPL